MIRLKITPQQLERAKTRFDFGELKNSIKKGTTNLHGAIGEIIVLDYYLGLKVPVLDESTKDYDLIIKGLTVDVKTRLVNRAPKPCFRCSLPAYNIDQKTQFYLFVFIDRKKEFVWLGGYISKSSYFKIAKFNKAGDKFSKHTVFKVDSYSITARQLEEIKPKE